MTVALCTNCGEYKFGAWCMCQVCGSEGLDDDVSLVLSDWHLTKEEMSQIGEAIQLIFKTELDESIRFALVVYYLSQKWPKLLTYDIDKLDTQVQKQLIDFYSNKLSGFQGQEK